MKQILMTSPSKFGVDYVINPWMENNAGKVDRHLAAQQWSELRNTLCGLGVDVVVLPAPPDYCPDAVFTANAGLIYKGKFIPSYFRYLERAAEEPFFMNWMIHSFDVVFEQPGGPRTTHSFEGAGDALFEKNGRDTLWLGFGYRTGLGCKGWLDSIFADNKTIVRPLQLVDQRFYHLDTCFCPLDTGELLWYPGAFDDHAQYVIKGMFGDKAITVHEEDAVKFACNAVSVDTAIVLPKITPYLKSLLTSRGYSVFEQDMSEFMKSGGACKCLTLEVV